MTIEELVRRPTIHGLSNAQALNAIGQLIDHAVDINNLDLNAKALAWAEALESRDLTTEIRAHLHYFRANAWGHRQAVANRDPNKAWRWEQEEARHQIFHLRQALNSDVFGDLPWIRQCEILTNLANQLDTVGRSVEARTLWTRALGIKGDFWMARGNRAGALLHYADAIYDGGHRGVFALIAHRDLVTAVADIDEHPSYGDVRLRSFFAANAEQVAASIDLASVDAHYHPNGHSLGRSQRERSYRRWALDEGLFLNPLNDVTSGAIAARDVLMLPSFTTGLKEPALWPGLFNQLKQEYASARFFLWEGLQARSPHFSDRGVLLYNTLDYPAAGLAVENVKLAFRMAYSILDKVAFFLNRYMRLEIPGFQVSFRKIWKLNGVVRPEFEDSENWLFRGLYWLSKDLYESGFTDNTEPEAREIADLRNHLEHKYVKVHAWSVPETPQLPELDPFWNDFGYAISLPDLEARSLNLIRLSRAALIYLVLGMHREEGRRGRGKHHGLVVRMDLPTLHDQDKRRL